MANDMDPKKNQQALDFTSDKDDVIDTFSDDDDGIRDILSEDGPDSDLGDSDDGIFSPMPPKKKPNVTAIAMVVVTILLVGGAGFFVFSNPDMMSKVGLGDVAMGGGDAGSEQAAVDAAIDATAIPADPAVTPPASDPAVDPALAATDPASVPPADTAAVPIDPTAAPPIDDIPQPQPVVNSGDDATAPAAATDVAADPSASAPPADVSAATAPPADAAATPPADNFMPAPPPADETAAVATPVPDAAPAQSPASSPVAATSVPDPVVTPPAETPAPPLEPLPSVAAPVAAAPSPVTPSDVPKSSSSDSVSSSAQSGRVTPAAPSTVPNDLVYYDATPGALQDTGPRRADPVTEPGATYVVVSKKADAGEMESLLVAANRALKLGRYDAAIGFYDRLYKMNPRDQRILMGRAIALQNLGQRDRAIAAYDDVLALNPNNADALVNMLGLVRGQYPAVALQKLLDVRERYPDNAGVAAQLGITYADTDNLQDALKYLSIASSLEPGNAQHYFNIGVVAERQKNRSLAIQMYEKALEADSMNASARSIGRDKIYDRLTRLRG